MENRMEELFVDDGSQRMRLVGEPPFEPILERGRHFQFLLCHKQTSMGEVPLEQWWMDTGTLYGQRQRRAINQKAVIDYGWALCMKHLTILHEPQQDAYILAHLLPFARSNGARKVFVDSIPDRRGNRKAASELISELETRLAASCDHEMGMVEFRDLTADLLGPPRYCDEVQACYQELAERLLGEGREALQRVGESGLTVALDRWREWMNGIGRHRGHELEKQALDILSYECRTALHQWYSAVWFDLIPYLANKYQLSDEWVLFHRLWNLEPREESDQPELTCFHLFHGHIFALHPACGRFIQTHTGSALVGQWLVDPGSEAAYQRLLHGIYVACDQYARETNVRALLRKGEGRVSTVSDMAALEEQQWENRSGRRRRRR